MTRFLLAAPLLLLGACGGRAGDGNGAAAANLGAAAGATNAAGPLAPAPAPAAPLNPAGAIQPGLWEMSSAMNSVEAPGMAPAELAQLRGQLASQRATNRQCITAAQAADPARQLIGRDAQRQGCTFDQTQFAGGVIRIGAACARPGDPTRARMRMAGSFSATELRVGLEVELSAPARTGQGTQLVRMAGTMNGRRVGDCPAAPVRP